LIKPIPKKLLPNTILYKKYLGDSGTGDAFDTQKTITNVAFQEKKTRTAKQDGFIIIGKGTVFVDAKNSLVDDAAVTNDLFVEKSRIIFNSKTYIIKEIENLDYESGRGIHHWELMVN